MLSTTAQQAFCCVLEIYGQLTFLLLLIAAMIGQMVEIISCGDWFCPGYCFSYPGKAVINNIYLPVYYLMALQKSKQFFFHILLCLTV